MHTPVIYKQPWIHVNLDARHRQLCLEYGPFPAWCLPCRRSASKPLLHRRVKPDGIGINVESFEHELHRKLL